jgi:hypothetical protein
MLNEKMGLLFRFKENPVPTKVAYLHGVGSVFFQKGGV